MHVCHTWYRVAQGAGNVPEGPNNLSDVWANGNSNQSLVIGNNGNAGGYGNKNFVGVLTKNLGTDSAATIGDNGISTIGFP